MQNLTENVPKGANSGLIKEKGESLPSLPISQSASKQMSVVEWALVSKYAYTDKWRASIERTDYAEGL